MSAVDPVRVVSSGAVVDPAILVYDGGCGLCASASSWIERRWPQPGPRRVPSTSLDDAALRAYGLTRDDVTRAAWWIEGSRRREGAAALAAALAAATGAWSVLGRVVASAPLAWCAPWIYGVVARHRRRRRATDTSCERATL